MITDRCYNCKFWIDEVCEVFNEPTYPNECCMAFEELDGDDDMDIVEDEE